MDTSWSSVAAGCRCVAGSASIAIEYEGELHFLDEAIQRKDVYRYELLHALGWRVIRVTKDDLRFRRDELVERVRAAIAERVGMAWDR